MIRRAAHPIPRGMARDVLTIFHLLGLMLVSGGVLGSLVGLASAPPSARQKGARGPGRVHARIAIAGLVLLGPTGVALLITQQGAGGLTVMFWMKMVFAALLTFAVVSTEMTHARTKAGDKRSAGLLASLAPLAALSLVIAMVFSVLAFH